MGRTNSGLGINRCAQSTLFHAPEAMAAGTFLVI
jgi:hypothetical protein